MARAGRRRPDRRHVVTNADGSVTVTYSDGTVVITYPDGSSKTTLPDGTVVWTIPGIETGGVVNVAGGSTSAASRPAGDHGADQLAEPRR